MAALTSARLLASSFRPVSRVFTKCSVLTRPLPLKSRSTLSRTVTTSSRLLDDKKYSTDHEWVLTTGDDQATVGITEYAQEKLGDIVFIELPEVGATFSKDDVFGTVESVKAASDVIAPLSGEVTERNPEVEENPVLVNNDPYGEGWLVKMKLSEPSELDGLMSEDEYTKFVEDCD